MIPLAGYIFGLCIVLVSVLAWRYRQWRKELPPGPPCIPFIGNFGKGICIIRNRHIGFLFFFLFLLFMIFIQLLLVTRVIRMFACFKNVIINNSLIHIKAEPFR